MSYIYRHTPADQCAINDLSRELQRPETIEMVFCIDDIWVVPEEAVKDE